MDLISRKALLAAYDERHKGPPGGARELIEDATSIPAVPLDKLCEWLEENAALPTEEVYMISGMAWKRKLTKWMEGLDALN